MASDSVRMAEVEKAILDRAPEHDLVPTLDRIADVCSLLGDPQKAFRAVHVTGTNGKTSTTRIVERLLREHGLRTGRFTSPHLSTCASGSRSTGGADARAVRRHLRGRRPVRRPRRPAAGAGGEPRMTFFEVLVAMAYAAFADAPVEVAAVEVGWAARGTRRTSSTRRSPWSCRSRSTTSASSGTTSRRSPPRRPGSSSRARRGARRQPPDAAGVLLRAARRSARRRCARGWSSASRAGRSPSAASWSRSPRAAATTRSSCRSTASTRRTTRPPPSRPSRRCSARTPASTSSVVRAALADVDSPGRLEVVRRGPTVVVDAAHNPPAPPCSPTPSASRSPSRGSSGSSGSSRTRTPRASSARSSRCWTRSWSRGRVAARDRPRRARRDRRRRLR